MIELRPIPIILISFFCFLVGLFLFSVTANAIFSNSGISDFFSWLPVVAAIVLAFVLVSVGIGILYYNQLCWKILFFLLIIYIANFVSFVLVLVTFLCLDTTLFYKFYQDIHIASVTWFSFCSIFLFGVIALYYLTRDEIVMFFGEMGGLIEPF
jgi:hypothetical protein